MAETFLTDRASSNEELRNYRWEYNLCFTAAGLVTQYINRRSHRSVHRVALFQFFFLWGVRNGALLK